jgi:predicted HAD superfamily phosphohydrolase
VAEEDWKKLIDAADAEAAAEADDVVKDDLDQITAQADQLRDIFDELKMTDPATYDELIKIVDDATAKNESVASVVDRLKALGAAGKKLAGSIANVASGAALNVTSGGAIGILQAALKSKLKS